MIDSIHFHPNGAMRSSSWASHPTKTSPCPPLQFSTDPRITLQFRIISQLSLVMRYYFLFRKRTPQDVQLHPRRVHARRLVTFLVPSTFLPSQFPYQLPFFFVLFFFFYLQFKTVTFKYEKRRMSIFYSIEIKTQSFFFCVRS